MDITAITAEMPAAARVDAGTARPETTGKEFDTLLFEMLLKASGFAEAFIAGGEGGQETAVFGDLAIQVLASEMARDMHTGASRTLTTKTDE
jgi:hypothetical protein